MNVNNDLYIGVLFNSNQGTTEISYTDYTDLIITIDNPDMSYVPYGCIGIKKVNKNLFNVNNIDYGYINSSGVFVQGNNNVINHNYIPVQTNESFVISANASMSGMGVVFYDNNIVESFF